jgi:PAS domain S-box-containing protein
MRDISDRKRQENALRFMVEGTMAKTGEEFFQACVQYLAENFQVQYAFITKLVDSCYNKSKMLALWTGETFVEPYEFDLAGTPCSKVFEENWGFFPDSLQAHFPQADALATLGAESYLGVVIRNTQGKAIGNLGIIHTQPLTQDLDTIRFILQIFATRVGAEMERQAAEAKLQQQEAFLRTVYEGANHPIFVIDVAPDGEFRYVGWNHAAETVSGMSSQAISGKTPEEIYGLEAGRLEQQRLQECLLAKQSTHYEERLVFNGQETCWITTYNPIQDSQGKVYRFIGTAFEISARKAAEAALEEYAERQTLLHQLSNQIRQSLDLEAVIATTIESIRELLVIDFCAFAWYNTEAHEAIWEVIQESKVDTLPSSLGRYPVTFVGPVDVFLLNQKVLRIDNREQYAEPIHRAFMETVGSRSELLVPIQTHTNQMGVIICGNHAQVRPWADNEIELLEAIGNQLAIAIFQASLYAESCAKSQQLQSTLHKLQKTQTQMLQSEKMSSLGQLVAGIAHEINNPVNFIHGNLTYAGEYVQDLLELIRLYQETYPQPTPAIAQQIEEIDLDFLNIDLPKLLTSMQVGTHRIREIVQSLRIFSRLDEAEVKPVDIHDGIDSTLMILHHRIKATLKRSEIQIIKDYDRLPTVECFAGQLNQVFMNILANAIDALDERDQERLLDIQKQKPSTIHIQTKLLPNDQVLIRIADNGPGIPQEVQQRLFDPFFTTKPVGKGTGMGMSISYQIVTEKHRGELFCNSVPGEGAEFVIQIPIRQNS